MAFEGRSKAGRWLYNLAACCAQESAFAEWTALSIHRPPDCALVRATNRYSSIPTAVGCPLRLLSKGRPSGEIPQRSCATAANTRTMQWPKGARQSNSPKDQVPGSCF